MRLHALSLSPKLPPFKGARRKKKKVKLWGSALQTFGFNQITEEIKRRAEMGKSKPKEQSEKEKQIDFKVLVQDRKTT